MGKGAVSIADSCYLHIKLIGRSSYDSSQLHKDFHRVMLEGCMESSQMFSKSAMCQWVNLLYDKILSFIFYFMNMLNSLLNLRQLVW